MKVKAVIIVSKENEKPAKTNKTPKTVEDDDEDDDDLCLTQDGRVTKTNSMHKTEITLIAGMAGMGFITLPYSLQEAGVGLGIFLMILTAYVSDYASQLMIKSAIMTKSPTYAAVMIAAFGKTFKNCLLVINVISLMIGLVASNIAIADIAMNILQFFIGTEFPYSFLGSRIFVLVVINAVVVFPLGLFHDVVAYTKVVMVAVVLKVIIIVFITIRMATINVPQTDDAFRFYNGDFAQAMGLYALTFGEQTGCLFELEFMDHPTQKRAFHVNHITVSITLLINILTALIGYTTFTGHTQGNIMLNFCNDDIMMLVGNFMFLVSMLIGFPMSLLGARLMVAFQILERKEPLPFKWYLPLNICLQTIGVAGSMVTSCLGIVMEIMGVGLSVPFAYFLPPIAALIIQPGKILSKANIPIFLVIAYGLVIFINGIFVTVKEIMRGVSCLHTSQPDYCALNASALAA